MSNATDFKSKSRKKKMEENNSKGYNCSMSGMDAIVNDWLCSPPRSL